jgi:predicted acetyltransferase
VAAATELQVAPCRDHEELAQALDAIGHYFGLENTAEDADRFAQWIEVERMHAARDGDRIVGGAGAFTYDLSVPGGSTVPSAGVTVVGVLPTYRRRGVLTAMMRAQLDDVRARGESVAWLWASESTIYGRFGYGLASLSGQIELPRERTAFARPFQPEGSVRWVDADEALELFPPVQEAVMRERPGMFRRSRAWWETRRLHDDPTRRRAGSGPLQRVVVEVDGRPEAYALYRMMQSFDGMMSTGAVNVIEALGATPGALATIWRWLLDMDWTATIKADLLPIDHPLFLLLAEPRRMKFRVGDGLWVRLVDVGAALSARAYAATGPIVLEVQDRFCDWNEGRWRLAEGRAEQTDAEPDLALDVSDLGSVYLGGFTWQSLLAAGRVEERTEGAVERADGIFGVWPKPWCPEIF